MEIEECISVLALLIKNSLHASKCHRHGYPGKKEILAFLGGYELMATEFTVQQLTHK